MTDEHSSTAEKAPSRRRTVCGPFAPDCGPDPALKDPYLKVFGPDIGVFEYRLTHKTVAIGRSEHADIILPHPRVSRAHATITYNDGVYTLEDVGSQHGTTVNRKRINSCALRHGDSIQIGLYLLQYRTHPAIPGAAEAASRAKLLLRSEYCMLPSTMRLEYRTLAVEPKGIFHSGDTLKIGHGGLLIPTETPPDDATCLELHLSWPSDVSKAYLGEVVGVIEGDSAHWLCVKLHTVQGDVHQTAVNNGNPGPWVEVVAT